PRLADQSLSSLLAAAQRLAPVYETVRRVRVALPPQTTFLGFAGSPWTVATYMVAGQGSREQAETRRLAYRDAQAFQAIIDAIVAATVDYLSGQVDAGVDAIQLFD
ncbi:uroporphyrinogen decarboxylase family protein, partial [Klebsiella pneumoniae]|uniref:uroporphyrinogen decarboxylase family protein n=1 Tax=Klebsiella pneumoniae TaxID=573 RepID=UPI0027D31674